MTERELITKFGSPLYVYNERILWDRCTALKSFEKRIESELSGIKVSMHYPVNANENPTILEIVKDSRLKVECMSPFEEYLSVKCGFKPDEMLYICNNISDCEMTRVHQKGIPVCLDSISQVDTWGRSFPGTKIMVRICSGPVGGYARFGTSEANLLELLETANRYNLTIIGCYQHSGNLFLNDQISMYIDEVREKLKTIKRNFNKLEIVNLGGGFGIPYKLEEEPLTLTLLANKLIPVLKKFADEYSSLKEIQFESGHYVTGESGQIIGKVTAIKCEDGIYWIGTDIGMNTLAGPSMNGAHHIIALPESKALEEAVKVNFCGNTCDPKDILGTDRYANLPQVGDIVIVNNTGAYGYSMASNYPGRTKPAEVMLRVDGKAKLIRRREKIEDMMRVFCI